MKRLRAKYRQLGLPVDTVVVHHFHHLLFSPGDYIVNGSLKGYDAMAMRFSFPYQPPMLGMWFVHPERGITSMWGIHADDKVRKAKGTAWASIERAA